VVVVHYQVEMIQPTIGCYVMLYMYLTSPGLRRKLYTEYWLLYYMLETSSLNEYR